MDLDRLKEPFPADAIEWRAGQVGVTRDGRPWCKVLAYIDARAVMDRLDDVCGPAGWEDHYETGPQGGVVCRLTIHHPARSVTREDGAENTDVEGVKGGISDALKRAGVKFGIGRYLYRLGENWADCTTENMRGQEGWRYAKGKTGDAFWWKPPTLPDWALPPKEIAKAKAVKATKGAVKPATQLRGPDPAAVVRDWLRNVCKAATVKQADACINEVTGGLYTAAAELDDQKAAREIHDAFKAYADDNRLDGLAHSVEVGTQLGL